MRDLPEGAAHCAVVKAAGYGHGAVPVAKAALEAGVHLARRRHGARGGGAPRGGPHRADPDLRPAHRHRAGAGRALRRRGRGLVAGVHRRGRPARRAGARQVRHRHGPPGRDGARGPRALRAGARRRRAPRPHEPLRHRGRGRRQLLRAAAAPVREAGRGAQGAVPRPPVPHRQQRGDAARAARPLRHGPHRHRPVRAGAGQRRPLQGRPAAGHEVHVVRRRRARAGARRLHRLRPHVLLASRSRAWPSCRSATPTACAAR